MKTIYKMILSLGPSGIVTLRGADLLSVKGQHGRVVAYFLVPITDEVETERHNFFVVPTGVLFNFQSNGMEFIDTVMLESGNLVYHVFKQGINK